jgi:hypothetical protein
MSAGSGLAGPGFPAFVHPLRQSQSPGGPNHDEQLGCVALPRALSEEPEYVVPSIPCEQRMLRQCLGSQLESRMGSPLVEPSHANDLLLLSLISRETQERRWPVRGGGGTTDQFRTS